MMNVADWIQNNTRLAKGRPDFTLTPEQRHLATVLCVIAAPYNLGVEWEHVEWGEHYMAVTLPIGRSLSTYDDDGLTRLVVAAHDAAVRIEVSPSHTWAWGGEGERDRVAVAKIYRQMREEYECSPAYAKEIARRFEDGAPGNPSLRILLSLRQRGGSMFERHPNRIGAFHERKRQFWPFGTEGETA